MTRSPSATSGEETLYAALELSKNSWFLAIQLPERDNPSLHPIKGGDAPRSWWHRLSKAFDTPMALVHSPTTKAKRRRDREE